MLLTDVALMEHRITLVGALGGLLAHAGRRLEPWYLAGVTGHAFRLTLDLVISPSAPHELNFHEVFPLWERLGVWFKRVAARPRDPGYADVRAEVIERVVQAVQRGRPAIVYDLLGCEEYGLVVGVEGDRWACLTPGAPTEPQWMEVASWPPADHAAFTRAEVIALLDLTPDFDRRAAEVASLRFAVDHFWAPASRDMWLQHGRQAYQFWRTTLAATGMPLHGPEPGRGHSYNLAVLHAARSDAAAYLADLAGRYPEADALQRAVGAYRRVADALAEASALAPYPGAPLAERRAEVAACLDRALAAETEGIEAIERALRALR
ncbi:hypothetical protein [Symbiobacterium thermophilum]|uniref:Uncharacterized protein n=2 Tax=Symbiobacterium thermophilum TaxID=2734 RepID=Q67P30_SYMTH|nr:hypothetical protein [Symbiobacterium thermophilum]BAD40563.1 hypothetical protein STH1578 [Symbiobacterium thermophilum IAM 14863]